MECVASYQICGVCSLSFDVGIAEAHLMCGNVGSYFMYGVCTFLLFVWKVYAPISCVVNVVSI